MDKDDLNKAIKRIEKEQERNLRNRKKAIERGDVKGEIGLSEKISDYKTVLWALGVSQIAIPKGFESHIMNRFLKIE